MTKAVALFFDDGPARLILLAGTLAYRLAGIRGDELKGKQARLVSLVRCSALPVGLGAAGRGGRTLDYFYGRAIVAKGLEVDHGTR